jgi:hypothetical protein
MKRNNSKTVLKTVSMPKEVYTLIEQLATEQKLSVHTLIIEMLKWAISSYQE